MNPRKGFRRLTLAISLLVFVAMFLYGILSYDDNDDVILWVPCAFAGIWVIYGITFWVIVPSVRWIAKGFGDGESGEQVKNNSPQKMSPAAKQLLFDIIKWTIIIIIAAIVYIIVQHILTPTPVSPF